MNIFRTMFVLTLLIVGGCSGGEDNAAKEQSTDHVWKTQTDTIEKARQTEQQIMDAAKQQRQAIDEQSK